VSNLSPELEAIRKQAFAKADQQTLPEHLTAAMADVAWWEDKLTAYEEALTNATEDWHIQDLNLHIKNTKEILVLIRADAINLNRKLSQ